MSVAVTVAKVDTPTAFDEQGFLSISVFVVRVISRRLLRHCEANVEAFNRLKDSS